MASATATDAIVFIFVIIVLFVICLMIITMAPFSHRGRSVSMPSRDIFIRLSDLQEPGGTRGLQSQLARSSVSNVISDVRFMCRIASGVAGVGGARLILNSERQEVRWMRRFGGGGDRAGESSAEARCSG